MTPALNLTILAAGAAPAHLNPVKLFMDADIVVQLVMLGLLAASVWVWTIIVSFSLRVGAVRRRCRSYEGSAAPLACSSAWQRRGPSGGGARTSRARSYRGGIGRAWR